MREAILIASYGGRAEPGRVSGLALLQKEIEEQTGLPVLQAYYNKALLREEPDKALEIQMDRLRRLAPEKLTVLPTFLVNGKTWTAFREQIEAGWEGCGSLQILEPVLQKEETRDIFAQRLAKALGLDPRKNYLFVGHGAGDQTDLLYLETEKKLRALGFDRLSFALLHGVPGIREAAACSCWDAGREVHVIPFLVSAGKHMMRDLAGEHPDCAAGILSRAVWQVQVSSCGLMENPQVRECFASLSHIK